MLFWELNVSQKSLGVWRAGRSSEEVVVREAHGGGKDLKGTVV